MSIEEKLIQAFVDGLQIKREQVNDDLTYMSIQQWDSLAHMTLVSAIEQSFDIMLDTDDIIDMNSVAKAKEIIEKYGVSS
jgi:acyl carrier protein